MIPMCVCGSPVEQDGDSCGDYRCHQHMLGWGGLILRREVGGWRHYLRGVPVHCGDLLLARSKGEHIVRYESPLATSEGEPPAWLYHDHNTASLASDTPLRWPHRLSL